MWYLAKETSATKIARLLTTLYFATTFLIGQVGATGQSMMGEMGRWVLARMLEIKSVP